MSNDAKTKKALMIVLVPIIGFVLLILAFLFAFLVQRVTFMLFRDSMIPFINHIINLVLILLISYFVYRSKLKDTYKAIFTIVPVAVLITTAGLMLYNWPIIAFLASALIVISALYYLYKKKKEWYYYYAVLLPTVALLIMYLTGTQI